MKIKSTLTLIILCILSVNIMAQIKIIAHRGASAYSPENSIAAFKKAFELNADAVELDIWKTTDDSLVVNHDRSTLRTFDKDLVVPESSAAELRELRMKNGEKMPYLQEVLDILPQGKKIVIEIKCGGESGKAGNVFPMLKRILLNSGRLSDAILIAFNANALSEAKKELPSTKCYWLISSKSKLIETCKKYNFDGLDVNQSILNDSVVQQCKDQKLDLLVWTVDKPEKAIFAKHLNYVSGITTNKPDLIREVLKSEE